MGANAQDLISRVMKGEKAATVVGQLRSGEQAPPQEIDPSPRPQLRSVDPQLTVDQDQMLLGYLRPGDRFKFLNAVPKFLDRPGGPRIKEEYVIVAAVRGYVSFATGHQIYTLPLTESLQFDVDLVSSPGGMASRRFYIGDQVRHRISGSTGVVIEVGPSGYMVRFSGSQELVEIPGQVLALMNKDETTKSYLVYEDSKWVVQFGDYRAECTTLLEAIKTLKRVHPSAFNRWSTLVSSDLSFELGRDEIRYLVKVDPRVWNDRRLLRRRGFVLSGREVDRV